MRTVYTFGDSILDCAGYNSERLDPGTLIVRNDDRTFPEFFGRDLAASGPARLDHRAVDGSTIADLAAQARGLVVEEGPAIALLTIGGNDLLGGLGADAGPGIEAFARELGAFLEALPIRPVLLGNVYDPTFGDDSRNFTGLDPALVRANHRRVNRALAGVAARSGILIDLHAHFLAGLPSWYTSVIEPSLIGASEVRRCFLPAVLEAFGSGG